MLDGVDEGQAGARTALVVAVNPDRRDALGRELTTAGIEPELATDGRQAERSAKAALPDVLILDQGLPGLALFRLYSTLRGLPGGSDVPIFFVGQTGTDTPTDHYLSAELSLREVVDRVRDDLGLSALPPTAPPPTLGAAVPTTELPPAAAPTEPDLGGSTEVAGPGLATGTSSALAGVTFEPAVDEPATPVDPATIDQPRPGPGSPTVAQTEPLRPERETIGPEPYRADSEPTVGEPAVAAPAPGTDPPAAATKCIIPPTVEPPTVDRPTVDRPTIVPDPRTVAGVLATDPTVVPVPPVVTPDPAAPPEQRSPVPAGEPVSRISRLDVVLLRLGLVLLLLGGAVLLLRPDSSTQPIAPPNLATATPAATRTAPPSPSPAAVAAPGR